MRAGEPFFVIAALAQSTPIPMPGSQLAAENGRVLHVFTSTCQIVYTICCGMSIALRFLTFGHLAVALSAQEDTHVARIIMYMTSPVFMEISKIAGLRA
jgi:hypothetical protein